jgi:biotin operon repressor
MPPKSADIYFCPNLFEGSYRRIHEVKKSCWLYADLDEVDPQRITPRPTVAWESSSDRYQALWRLDKRVAPHKLNELNKRLTYLVGADKGGWDLTQVLRLPGTYNHKYENPEKVTLLWDDGPTYTTRKILKLVKEVDPIDGEIQVPELEIPSKTSKELLTHYRKALDRRVFRLLRAKRPVEGERSDRLWELENLLLSAGMSPEEVFVVIRASVWNKYRGRADETYRIWLEIQKAARTQSGLQSGESSAPVLEIRPTGWEHHDLFMQSELPPPAWMIDRIWSDRSHGLIAGEPKGYKSLLATDMAISVASGTKFLGHYDTPVTGPVLMIQEENPSWLMQSRIRKIEKAKGILGEAEVDATTLSIRHGGDVHLELLNQAGFDLTDPSHLELLERKVQVVRPVLIVLDPLAEMLGDAEENSNREMRPVLQWLRHLKVRYSCGVLIVHHYGKQSVTPRFGGQRVRGASAFHGWVESGLYVEKPDPENPHYIRISREHRGQTPQGSFDLEVFEGEPNVDDDYEVIVHDIRAKKHDALWRYVEKHPGVSIPALSKKLGKSRTQIARMAKKSGLEIRIAKGKGKSGRPPRRLYVPDPNV